jgi:hypothetical protein
VEVEIRLPVLGSRFGLERMGLLGMTKRYQRDGSLVVFQEPDES